MLAHSSFARCPPLASLLRTAARRARTARAGPSYFSSACLRLGIVGFGGSCLLGLLCKKRTGRVEHAFDGKLGEAGELLWVGAPFSVTGAAIESCPERAVWHAPGMPALRIGGAEDADDGRAERRGDMHRSAVVAHVKASSFHQCHELAGW